jgi:hypothetical protein
MKNEVPPMDRERIHKAQQANLAEYLISKGEPLIKDGEQYRHEEHEGLVFTENAYYWESKQENGNAIDYLRYYKGMTYDEAILALTSADYTFEERQKEDFKLDSLSDDYAKLRRYLDEKQAISYGVTDSLAKNELLYQEIYTNNAIFPVLDERNNCVGAEVHGVTEKRFRGIRNGNKYGYGFNVRLSDDGTYDYALFFESAIDLLSFLDYQIYHKKKTLHRCLLVSMAGLNIGDSSRNGV